MDQIFSGTWNSQKSFFFLELLSIKQVLIIYHTSPGICARLWGHKDKWSSAFNALKFKRRQMSRQSTVRHVMCTAINVCTQCYINICIKCYVNTDGGLLKTLLKVVLKMCISLLAVLVIRTLDLQNI